MTRDTANQLSTSFEGLGWNHTVSLVGADRVLSLEVSEMNGDQLLLLFGVLAPGGVPLPGIAVSLSGTGLAIR